MPDDGVVGSWERSKLSYGLGFDRLRGREVMSVLILGKNVDVFWFYACPVIND